MLVRALRLQLTGGETLVGALNALVTSKWTSSVVNGQTILSTSEAGESVTFTFDRDLGQCRAGLLRHRLGRQLLHAHDSTGGDPAAAGTESGMKRPTPCSMTGLTVPISQGDLISGTCSA